MVLPAAQGRRLGLGGAGDCLRTNFKLVSDTVRSCDGHLLSAEEHALLETFQVGAEGHLLSSSLGFALMSNDRVSG